MAKIELDVAFEIGQPVLYKNKIGKDEGIVSGYSVRKGSVSYAVTWSDKQEKYHFDFELKAAP